MLSNLPLSGNYFIECYEVGDAEPHFTGLLSWSASDGDVYNAIIASSACPNLRNKFSVINTRNPYYFAEDGLNFLLFFEYAVGDSLPQFKIHNNEGVLYDAVDTALDPLTADSGLAIVNSEVQARGSNIYYEVIPYEFIYTDETSPQVMVTIDDQAALCTSLACDYTYVEPTTELTSMTVSGLDVVIAGTDLPTVIDAVTLGFTPCSVTASDTTSIACTLESDLMAGTWSPQVTDANGLLPVAGSLTPAEVALVIADV